MTELVHVKGLAELERRLAALPAAIAKQDLRRALAAGARVVRDAARAAAPIASAPHRRGGRVVPPGTLKRAALIKFVRELSNDHQVEYIVAFRKGKKQQAGNRDAFYASWVEFGHKIVPRKRKGQVIGRRLAQRRAAATGRVPPHRFFGPAFEASKFKALDAMTGALTLSLRDQDHP